MDVDLSVLTVSVCRYCNNWFNQANSEADFNPADLPIDLEKTIENIAIYLKEWYEKNNHTSETNGSLRYSVDLDKSSWERLFAGELAMYKRLKTV